MKDYPKIDYYNKAIYGQNVIAFDKLDGSNIRCEYSRKRGWYKFGTRTEMIDKNHEIFGKSIPLFLEKYGDSLDKIFRDKYKKVENFVVFSEYVGPNSFAGWHDSNDIMDIILFDVNQYKKGFISPWEFLDNFSSVDIPKIIYEGKLTDTLIENVRNDVYGLKEGAIIKGLYKTKKDGEIAWRIKAKTIKWLKQVKERLGEKALMEELNNDKFLIDIYE
jgi:hypothetical protein